LYAIFLALKYQKYF